MKDAVKKFFLIKERDSRISTEIMAGIVTFLTMSYIIFLQPMILSGQISGTDTGMPPGAIMTGVCVASALACFLMGVIANYPIALAPGMGENFFFLTTISACAALGAGVPWQTALAVVFISGIIFLLLTLFRIRNMIMDSISPSLQYAIGCGIGLFIALLGLEKGGIVKTSAYGIYLGNIQSVTVLIFAIGFFTIAALQTLKVKGAVLWGILAAALAAVIAGKIGICFPVKAPESVMPIFCKMDFASVWTNIWKLLPFIVIFTFMDVFDTIGTLVGVSAQANLMKNNKLPGASKAMTADSIGTVFGAMCGNSTVTSYIESAAGVSYGGRTGLTAIVTGICFLLSMFFYPLVAMVGAYPGSENPITAPALVIVGMMMFGNITKIKWDDFSEAIPAFLIIIGIPFTSSIADGMILGFIAYPVIKLLSGRARETSLLTYFLAAILILYLIFIKSQI
ncbi:MAG: hypothetical protein A2020_00835 [Lentisphaerae bacterium GWF2_45_14]|nr:MAG: hypothetical protein A2020_00835 [Lentisphaerae bacterium GWF2_45_14]